MKKVIRFAFCLLVLCLCLATAKAQSSNDSYKIIKGSNGQTYLIAASNMGSKIFLDFSFRIGSIYEFDSTSGVSLTLSKMVAKQVSQAIKSSGKGVLFSTSVEPDITSFHFEADLNSIDYILSTVHDKILFPKLSEDGLEEAKTEITSDIDSMKRIPSYGSEVELNTLLWSNDYAKISSYGDMKTYQKLSLAEVKNFHHKYYLPHNNTVLSVGNITERELMPKYNSAFKDFTSTEFNPELITRVIEFRQVVNLIQRQALGYDKNIATVSYQQPGARQDRRGSYCAYILGAMINDPEGKIQKMLTGRGFNNLRATYSCNNFYGTMKLSLESKENKIMDMFRAIQLISDTILSKDYFAEGEVERTARNIGIEYKDYKANHLKDYMTQVVRFRFGGDELYFSSLDDSLNTVTPIDMLRYVQDYFAGRPGVRYLYSGAYNLRNVPEGQKYYPLDERITDTKFYYDLNKSDVEADTAKRDLERVIQWLKINPDMHIQINGIADEGEYKKATDQVVMNFLDSTPTFRKAMPDVIKTGYLRIEMMRAIKIAKTIYEAGIGVDRINGTSMVFSSDSKEKEKENRKCTITIEKIKPHLSLYESHYGKKKEVKGTE